MCCIVWGCANTNLTTADPSVHYYVFPKHPLIVQKWIEACGWPAEQIDLNMAHICSIHFDDNSYMSEVKIDNYDQENSYTRILKYDAVPTLYLPSTTQLVEGPVITQQLPEMIVFTVPTTQIQEPEADSKNYIELQVHQPTKADNEKYQHVQTKEQLQTVLNCNKTIREKVNKLHQSVKLLREAADKQMDLYRKKDLELSNLHLEYLRTKRSFLPLQQQKMLLSKVFSESQIKILSGKKKIYWSNDDMAVGYTIRHLSNKRCYLYLTKRLNIPLPAVSSIKRWMTMTNKTSLKVEEAVKKNEDEDSE